MRKSELTIVTIVFLNLDLNKLREGLNENQTYQEMYVYEPGGILMIILRKLSELSAR